MGTQPLSILEISEAIAFQMSICHAIVNVYDAFKIFPWE